jgi:hypothetical protein
VRHQRRSRHPLTPRVQRSGTASPTLRTRESNVPVARVQRSGLRVAGAAPVTTQALRRIG